ncbi:TetR/AcrR family transcriptional regulator [Streptomyces sparsogenes]|uniref:TetR/AcrR family transcriptional regulator n=1 Tax=Streptomyces sparsogenes TaxID=67365 RepID=UPI0033C98C5B
MTTTEHSGGGDISRSLELLWGTGERPSRGPKPGLTLERIVTAAIAVADAEGLAAVSMRRLSAELGAGTMSLYRYVPGKAELLDLMLDQVQAFDPDAHAPDLGWRETLEMVARGSWQLYERHPWLLQVDQARPILGPNAMAGLEFALRGLDGLGLTDRERIHVIVTVEGFATGIARTHVNSTMAEKRTGVSDEEFWKAHTPALEKALASGRFPMQAALGEDAFSGRGEDAFEFGLKNLLDGIGAFIATRARARETAAER